MVVVVNVLAEVETYTHMVAVVNAPVVVEIYIHKVVVVNAQVEVVICKHMEEAVKNRCKGQPKQLKDISRKIGRKRLEEY
ncbi:hypothetical protein LXL04_014484 [Taraxacum kok-saghyz]